MHLKRFQEIETRYSNVASWACWAPQTNHLKRKSGISDLTIFDPSVGHNCIQLLHTNFVLVGLNISRDDICDGPWRNFHSDNPFNTDYKLREIFIGTKLWGAYMTDILKDFPEPKSNKVLKYCKDYPYELDKHVQNFCDEISFVCANQTELVALGDLTYKILNDRLGINYKIHKIFHYASTKTIEQMRSEVIKI